MIRRLESECSGSCASLLVDGGDLFQGTPASNLAFGRPVVTYYNALGYAAAAVGNHEFDWGQDTLRARMKDAGFAILSANVRDTAGRALPWIRPDTMVVRGGVRIGIIGLSTVETPRTTRTINVANLRFLDPVDVVNERARSLRARGAEMVIVLAHAGSACAATCTGEMADLAMRVGEPIDAIVGGHTHTAMTGVVRGVNIQRAFSSGRSVAVTDLPVDPAMRAGVATRNLFVTTDSIAPEPQVEAIVRAALAPVQGLVRRPVATVAEDLLRHGPQHALGNLIADAQRAAAGTNVAVMNNGGIRADLRAGPATYGSFFEIEPFANLLVRMTVRGTDLRAYFERLMGGRAPNVHISGAAVRYDPTQPPGSRLVEATVAGSPIDDTRTYTVSLNDFMVTGGDGLELARPALKVEELGIVDLDALLEFVGRMPGNVVRADAAPRIVAVPK